MYALPNKEALRGLPMHWPPVFVYRRGGGGAVMGSAATLVTDIYLITLKNRDIIAGLLL